MKYTKDEVYKSTLEYFSGDELAANVWIDKYCLKDSEGNLFELNPNDMHKRLSSEFSRIENKYDENKIDKSNHSEYGKKRSKLKEEDIFDLFKDFNFVVPQGSVMSMLGDENSFGSLSNCIVIPELFDSYGGILYADQQLVQLMKRRCVEENTKVITKEKGIISIKDVEIGMNIYSFNLNNKKSEYKKILNKFETEVKKEDRTEILYSNGTILKTSKNHPILVLNEEYNYKKVSNLNIGDICIKPEKSEFENFDDKLSDLAWFIGAHIGDGTAGLHKQKNRNNKIKIYETIRFRILGDNENVIKKYSEILNNLTGSNAKYYKSTSKRYKSDVWLYCNVKTKLNEVVEKYLDGQIGKKVYSAKTPSFIKNNNLWIPYIAGLIDTDGTIKGENTIQLDMCAENIISDVCLFLNKYGITYHVKKNEPKRINEKPIYRILINSNEEQFIKNISKYMHHENKISKIINNAYRPFSHVKKLTNNEVFNIIENYKKQLYIKGDKDKKNNLSSCIILMKKENSVGIGSLNIFKEYNLLSDEKYNEINKRVIIKQISQDLISEKYIDIEVEDNNNFYAGEFGFVNIHNCGVGLDISTLRPDKTIVTNAAKSSTGAVSFMERFSNTTKEVAMNNRRGALIITIDINHPDVEKFITIKSDLKKVTGANISLKITDDFMQAVEKDEDFELKFPTHSDTPLVSRKIKAKELWNKVIKQANSFAEPGLIMWDRQHWYSTSSIYPEYTNISTNPCSEIAMGADSCRLIALNMFGCVVSPFTDKAKFNFDLWYKIVYESQRLMDDLVDLELESVERILNKIENDNEPDFIKYVEKRTWETLYDNGKKGRRTGLGFTALADTLAALNIKYDSLESLEIIEKIMKKKCEAEFDSSIDMAIERGKFSGFDQEIEKTSHFIQMMQKELPIVYNRMMKFGRRNVSISTIAPSGSVSLLTRTSSGIEPVFMLSYKRRKKISDKESNIKVDFTDAMGDKWQEFDVFHPRLKQWMDLTNKTIEQSPYVNCTAHDIDWKFRINIQSVCQKYVTHSISSTINLKSETTDDVVSDIYMESWKKGLKGITVYREGSRAGVLIKSEEKDDKKLNTLKVNNAPKRPKTLSCEVIRFNNNNDKWVAFVGLMLDSSNKLKPYEIFTGLSDDFAIPLWVTKGEIVKIKEDGISRYDFVYRDKTGKYKTIVEGLNRVFHKEFHNYSRLLSSTIRHGMPIDKVIELVEALNLDSDLITSWKKGIQKALKNYIDDGKISDKKCPECGQESLRYESGCVTCSNCSYGKCG